MQSQYSEILQWIISKICFGLGEISVELTISHTIQYENVHSMTSVFPSLFALTANLIWFYSNHTATKNTWLHARSSIMNVLVI